MIIFDKFKEVTRVDIQLYLEDFSSFLLTDYQRFVDYYQTGTDVPLGAIQSLQDLFSRMLQINDLFSVYIHQLSSGTTEIWELLDYFELTKVNLLTVMNSSRWLRSTKNVFRSNVVNNDFILRQGQTFEQLASEVGHTDPANDWVNLSMDNDVKEEDYSFEGGNKLKISFVNTQNIIINSVIDSVSGLKIYGKDIDRNFYFENNDLVILEYKDTIIQQTEILLGLVKGSVPEFPLDGIDKSFVGSNINSIHYPIILRQQAAVFEKDDRYKSIAINTFEVESDRIMLNIQVKTKLDEVLDEQLVL